MIILVSGASKTLCRLAGHPNLGQLLTPQAGNGILPGMVYAADNAAYSNWDEGKFLRMLDRLEGTAPLWVAAPDAAKPVCDAKGTYRLLKIWHPIIKKRGLPVAYVLQNGSESIGLPPDDMFDAIFIGGDDEFKMGGYAKYITEKMKNKGRWVHMGRVNSWDRIQYAYEIGCNSVDGSGFSMFPDTYIPKFLNYLKNPQIDLIPKQHHPPCFSIFGRDGVEAFRIKAKARMQKETIA